MLGEKVVKNILGNKPKTDRKSKNNIADDWNSMGTIERSISMASSRRDFLEYLEEANQQGYLSNSELLYYKNNTPKTNDYSKIVEWFYDKQ